MKQMTKKLVNSNIFFVEWCSNCWNEAGGIKFETPSYVCFHDEGRYLDLKQPKWISDEDKWQA